MLDGRVSLVVFCYSLLSVVWYRLFEVCGLFIDCRCLSLFVVRCLFSVCCPLMVLYFCVVLLGAFCVSFGGCRFSFVVCCSLLVFRRLLLVVRGLWLYIVFRALLVVRSVLFVDCCCFMLTFGICCWLQAVCGARFVVRCSLRVVCCMICEVRCLWLVGNCCSLFVICCLRSACRCLFVCCSLFVVRCAVFVVCCALCVVFVR